MRLSFGHCRRVSLTGVGNRRAWPPRSLDCASASRAWSERRGARSASDSYLSAYPFHGRRGLPVLLRPVNLVAVGFCPPCGRPERYPREGLSVEVLAGLPIRVTGGPAPAAGVAG